MEPEFVDQKEMVDGIKSMYDGKPIVGFLIGYDNGPYKQVVAAIPATDSNNNPKSFLSPSDRYVMEAKALTRSSGVKVLGKFNFFERSAMIDKYEFCYTLDN